MTSLRSAERCRRIASALAGATLLGAGTAHASFLSGDALDSAANVLSWAVLVLVPVIGITLFWMVHVLPEKIAHHRHHPQRQAIQTLCLLSLAFGGLLWPIAWLWAYTRPVAFKAAYGTDKHEDYFAAQLVRARQGELDEHELDHLAGELDAMGARAALPPDLRKLRNELAARHGGAAPVTGTAPAAVPGTPGEGRSA